MSTKALLLERIQQELLIREVIKNSLANTFLINEEDFTGKQVDDNQFVWDIDNKQSIKDKAVEYFNKIKDTYVNLAPEAKRKLKMAAVGSLLSLITLNNTKGDEKPLEATKNVIKHDIEVIADKILTDKENKKAKKLSYDDYIVATTLVGEAGGEGEEGMRAVANVLKNRAKAIKSKPANVALEPKQFSMWNARTVDGKTVQDIHKMYVKDAYPDNTVWDLAVKLTKEMNKSGFRDNTGGAVNYYNPDKANPSWGVGSDTWEKSKKIGNHIFGIDTSINWGRKWFNKISENNA